MTPRYFPAPPLSLPSYREMLTAPDARAALARLAINLYAVAPVPLDAAPLARFRALREEMAARREACRAALGDAAWAALAAELAALPLAALVEDVQPAARAAAHRAPQDAALAARALIADDLLRSRGL